MSSVAERGAMAAIGTPEVPGDPAGAQVRIHRYVTEMVRPPGHVSNQRRAVTAVLRSWGVGGDSLDSVVLAVSELLTNAVLYGESSSIGLSLAYDSFRARMRIAVNDRKPGWRAEPRRPGDDQEGGRGLLLVDAFSDEWGVSEDGCSTWCTIDAGSGGSR